MDVILETDVLVVGSGSRWITCCSGHRMCGVQLALVERFGCFGRNLTGWCLGNALVPPRGNYSTRTGLRVSSRTEPKKWVQRCQNDSFYLMKSVLRVSNWLLTRWCLTNKPHTSVHRQFVSPIMDSNTIVGNITEPKADGAATLTKRVIDATVDPMS